MSNANKELNLVVDFTCLACKQEQRPIITYMENPMVCVYCGKTCSASLKRLIIEAKLQTVNKENKRKSQ